jgi:hypothetical protein
MLRHDEQPGRILGAEGMELCDRGLALNSKLCPLSCDELAVHDVELPISQENEVPVCEPGQQLACPGYLLIADSEWILALRQPTPEFDRARRHPRPVRHRKADGVDRSSQALLKGRGRLLGTDAERRINLKTEP